MAPGHLVGQAADLVEAAAAAVALAGGDPGLPGQLAGDEAEDQQQDRHLDVVGVVDEQRQVRLRVEEVVGGGGGHRRHRPRRPAADRTGGDDDDAEDQRDVAGIDVAPHGHQRRAGQDGGETAEGDVDAPALRVVPLQLHDPVLRPARPGGNGIDTALTRPSGFLTRPWRAIALQGPSTMTGWFCST